MTDVPRRLPATPEERLRVLADHTAGGSDRGNTRFGKRVSAARPQGQVASPFTRTSSAGQNRITIQWFTDDIGSDAGTITAWPGGIGGAFDYGGTSIQLNTPDDGHIYLFDEGVYSVQISAEASNQSSLAQTAILTAGCGVLDAPNSMGFVTVLAGGTPDIGVASGNVAGSLTFYSQGQGFASGGLEFDTQYVGDWSSAGRVWITVVVQRIT